MNQLQAARDLASNTSNAATNIISGRMNSLLTSKEMTESQQNKNMLNQHKAALVLGGTGYAFAAKVAEEAARSIPQ